MKTHLLGLALLVAFGGCDNASTTNRDNTGVNERDADGDQATPLDQSNDQDDIDLTAEIRSKVLEIEDLSINGQNIKIISDGGHVVLRGPVESNAERDAIVQVATGIAGNDNVTSELEVDAD